MERRKFIGALSLAGIFGAMNPNKIFAATKKQQSINYAGNDRDYWWKLLNKMASPVVTNLANGTLIKNMPVEKAATFDTRSISVTYLEAVGRTYAGIAPWLALPDDETAEGIARKKLRTDAIKGLNKCFESGSPDALNFAKDYQPIVDAAYLAQAF